MNRCVLHSILIACMLLVSFSCSNNESEAERRIEFSKIVESRTSEDLLNDLYVGSDGDVEAIARILNITPSSIQRIRSHETEPTDQLETRIREVSLYYMLNSQSFTKLQSTIDPEYGWYDSILNFPSHHPWWFWSINIILLLLLIAFFQLYVVFLILLEMLIFLIAWLASLIFAPDAVQDSYQTTINPTVEQIK